MEHMHFAESTHCVMLPGSVKRFTRKNMIRNVQAHPLREY